MTKYLIIWTHINPQCNLYLCLCNIRQYKRSWNICWDYLSTPSHQLNNVSKMVHMRVQESTGALTLTEHRDLTQHTLVVLLENLVNQSKLAVNLSNICGTTKIVFAYNQFKWSYYPATMFNNTGVISPYTIIQGVLTRTFRNELTVLVICNT